MQSLAVAEAKAAGAVHGSAPGAEP